MNSVKAVSNLDAATLLIASVFLSIFLKFFNYGYVCMSVWRAFVYECRHLQRPEEGIRSPRAEVRDSCELSDMRAGNQT